MKWVNWFEGKRAAGKGLLRFALSGILLLALSGCNDLKDRPPAEPLNSSAIEVESSPNVSYDVRPAPKPTQTPVPTQTPAYESTQAEPEAPPAEVEPKENVIQPPPKETSPNVPDVIQPPASPAPTMLETEPSATPQPPMESPKPEDGSVNVQITVGDQTFSAKLQSSPTTQALIDLMPLTVAMDELNGNEKFYDLPTGFPTDAYRPADIKAGDLMLYGSNCLVLFYESFSTSYEYTRLGVIEDASGLSAALGSGSAQVTFQLT